MVQLWPHQALAAERLLNGSYSALWWQMRTGKTLASIAGSDDGDRLIVCPNSVKPTWVNDLSLWGQDSWVYSRNNRPKVRPRNVIVNYETLWRTNLLDLNWDSVIFDESLRLQNLRTKLWSYVHARLGRLRRVVLLSGTPCPEGYHQLITQSIVASGQFCGFTDPWAALRWGWVYDEDSYRWEIKRGIAEQAKAQLHNLGPVMSQAEAGILTRKLYQRMPVELGKRERDLWTQVLRSPEPLTGPQLGLAAQSCASGRNPDTGETTASAKLDAVVEFAEDLGSPVVILTRFTSSLRYLASRLRDKGLKVATIYGEDGGSEERGQAIRSFNAGEVQVIVANVAVVKVGLNLSHASTLIFAENSFSGEARIQAEERCTVMGKEAVEIVDFVSVLSPGVPVDLVGGIDDQVLQAVRDKKDFNTKSLRRTR